MIPRMVAAHRFSVEPVSVAPVRGLGVLAVPRSHGLLRCGVGYIPSPPFGGWAGAGRAFPTACFAAPWAIFRRPHSGAGAARNARFPRLASLRRARTWDCRRGLCAPRLLGAGRAVPAGRQARGGAGCVARKGTGRFRAPRLPGRGDEIRHVLPWNQYLSHLKKRPSQGPRGAALRGDV